MSPDQEQALLRKVDAIHDSLVGPLGIEENGLIYKVNNHDHRISTLERWRWYLVGIVTALIGLAKIAAAALGMGR